MKVLVTSPKFHILKFGALTLYRTEMVGQNVQKIANILDFRAVIKKGVSWPRTVAYLAWSSGSWSTPLCSGTIARSVAQYKYCH